MNDYISLRVDISPCSTDATDLMAAFLADAGYESFVADETGLTAYVSDKLYDETAVKEIIADFPMEAMLTVTAEKIEGQDWNEEWERNYFKPIVVGDRCVIHSSFHTDVPQAEYDIVIDPKMAFGTGHHATTSLMLSRLLDMDLTGLTVTDMGTGSGILAILAAMRGAKEVTGIEIDEAAYVNAIENLGLNGVTDRVKVIHGDASALSDAPAADLLLANINRNIITTDVDKYAYAMKSGASAAFSGYYTEDIEIIKSAAEAAGLKYIDSRDKDNWACSLFVKP